MNRKLLFFDIDGTLLAGGIPGYIPESAIQALKTAQTMCPLTEPGIPSETKQGSVGSWAHKAFCDPLYLSFFLLPSFLSLSFFLFLPSFLLSFLFLSLSSPFLPSFLP